MIYLVTGQPGNGKTLWTIQSVEALRVADPSRPVYQSGINGLMLPWLELTDPRQWFKCPEKSIIVIDECWRAFPLRKQGAVAPDYIEEFATHRHHGFDIFLITQHRHQLDTFVRKMVGRVINLVRKFGAERARVYQWEKDVDVDSVSEQKNAVVSDWEYPKEVYALYKSAEVHTVKRDFPWRRVWWLPVAVVGVVVLGGVAYHRLRHPEDVLGKNLAVSSGPGGTGVVVRGFDWNASDKPRLAGVLGSARRYDSLAHPVTAPYVAGCMKIEIGASVQCRCNDQAGADVLMSVAQCVGVMAHGIFDPTRRYHDVLEEEIARLNARDARGSSGGVASSEGGGQGGAGAHGSGGGSGGG